MNSETTAALDGLIDNIRSDIAVDTNLTELKLLLGALNSSDLKTATARLPLNVIFDVLNSQNEAQITNGCDVLRLVLPMLRSSAIVLDDDVSAPLACCLSHPHPAVKKLALDELGRHARADEMVPLFGRPNGKQILLAVFDCLCDDDTSIGLRAARFISSLGHSRMGTKFLCLPDVCEAALEKTSLSETHRTRLYQALVEIGVNDSECLRHLETQGYFMELISSFKTDDVLANLTILEIINPMAGCWHGFNFLSRSGIIKYMAEILSTAEEHPLKSLFYPGVVIFFGHVGQRYSQNLDADHPQVIDTVFRMAESIEESVFVTSLETVGMIASRRSGKSLLMTKPAMSGCMRRVYTAITQVPSDWKVRGLNSLSNIIHVEPSDTKSDLAAVSQAWFEEMGPRGFETVADLSRQPFADIKVAALEVLFELAPMRWGQTKIASNPALMAHLLGGIAEAKELRLKLLRVLAESDTSLAVFGEETLTKIKSAAEQTPQNGSASVQVEMMSL